MRASQIVILVALAISATSCKKKYCWKCRTTTYISPSGGQQPSVTNNVVCDKTESDIKDYQKAATTSSRSGNVTVNVVTACGKE